MTEDNSVVLSLHDLSQQLPNVRLCNMNACQHIHMYVCVYIYIYIYICF